MLWALGIIQRQKGITQLTDMELFVNLKVRTVGTKKVWVNILYEKGQGYWCYTFYPGYRYEVYVKFDDVIRVRDSNKDLRYVLSSIINDKRYFERNHLVDEHKILNHYEFIIRKTMNEIS